MLTKDNSFEPRIGTAQLVFGIIYALITALAFMFALHLEINLNQSANMQYFMAFLFFILTAKSFFIWYRVKQLIKTGTLVKAKLISCEPMRGITVLKAEYEVKDYGIIEIMTRLAGESVSHEIKRYLNDHKTSLVPALIVGQGSKKPRGMIMIRTISGHLDEKTIDISNIKDENTDAIKENANAIQESSNVDIIKENNAVNTENDVQSTNNANCKADADKDNLNK